MLATDSSPDLILRFIVLSNLFMGAILSDRQGLSSRLDSCNVDSIKWRQDIPGNELADILEAGLVELEGEVVEPNE